MPRFSKDQLIVALVLAAVILALAAWRGFFGVN